MPTVSITAIVTVDGVDYQVNAPMKAVVLPTPTPTPTPVPTPTPTPTPISAIPLSYHDPRFGGNTNALATNMASNATLTNKSITATGNTASIVTLNGARIKNCRVNSGECVRIGGGGTFEIDSCYLEATGTGSDHADTIQAYSPGSKGILKITNTCIKAHNTAATAGLFVADDWTGIIDLNGVVFWGGPYACRIHSGNSSVNTVRFKDVFFVGPFQWGAYLIDKDSIIEVWDNVRNATIVNGVLVPGNSMPRPTA
jgi:hypothetical protein